MTPSSHCQTKPKYPNSTRAKTFHDIEVKSHSSGSTNRRLAEIVEVDAPSSPSPCTKFTNLRVIEAGEMVSAGIDLDLFAFLFSRGFLLLHKNEEISSHT
jgi:hypothetical protein